MAGRGRARLLLLSPLLLAAAARAQLVRPRRYCIESVVAPPLVDEVCVNGAEYEVTRLVPNEGYVQMSGQTVAIFGTDFPPENVAALQCQVGDGALQPVTVVSPTEVRCPVPVLPGEDGGEEPSISLWLDGLAHTDVNMVYRLKAPDDGQRGGSNIVTPLTVIEYANWVGAAIGCVSWPCSMSTGV